MAREDRRKVSSRGRVTIPKRIRQRRGIEPGDVLEFDERGDGVLIARKVPTRLDAAYGSLRLDCGTTDELITELRDNVRPEMDAT